MATRLATTRMKSLVENLKREINLSDSTFVGQKRKIIELTTTTTGLTRAQADSAYTATSTDSGTLFHIKPTSTENVATVITLPDLATNIGWWCEMISSVTYNTTGSTSVDPNEPNIAGYGVYTADASVTAIGGCVLNAVSGSTGDAMKIVGTEKISGATPSNSLMCMNVQAGPLGGPMNLAVVAASGPGAGGYLHVQILSANSVCINGQVVTHEATTLGTPQASIGFQDIS